MSDLKFLFPSLCIIFLLGGCRIDSYPDPNAHDHKVIDPFVMMRNLEQLHLMLGRRVAEGEITPDIKDIMIRQQAQAFVKELDLETIDDDDAWRFADVLRQAGRWEDAYKALQIAVQDPETEDRRVNDNLQFARVAAHLGKVDEAIKAAKSTFDAEPREKAPILLAVLKEIVPEGKGKGHDAELGQLLEGAIEQHTLVVIDPNSPAGIAFTAAYPIHISEAWNTTIRLYRSANREDLMRPAIDKSEVMMRQTGSY